MTGSAPLAAWLLLVLAATSVVSYVLIYRHDLVKGQRPGIPPPRYLTVLGWLLALGAVVLFVFLVLVTIGTS